MTAKFPFKLSGSVFRFLYENFLYHDFSLQNFARGLQVKLDTKNVTQLSLQSTFIALDLKVEYCTYYMAD